MADRVTLKVSVSAENEPTFGARGRLTMQKWRASEDASTSALSSGLDLSSVNLVHTDTEERNEPPLTGTDYEGPDAGPSKEGERMAATIPHE